MDAREQYDVYQTCLHAYAFTPLKWWNEANLTWHNLNKDFPRWQLCKLNVHKIAPCLKAIGKLSDKQWVHSYRERKHH